jgi:hypothetical protein
MTDRLLDNGIYFPTSRSYIVIRDLEQLDRFCQMWQ